jgi:LAS superfamily LD-carboxypeptidase LdcB
MKKLIIPLFIALSVSACASEIVKKDGVLEEHTAVTDTPEVESKQLLTRYNPEQRYSALLWVEQANPVNDAVQALKQKDTDLWAYNTRMGPKVPGVDTDALAVVLKKHQLKLAPAMGDVVYGNEHLELRLKFVKYAQRYNQEILNN